MSVVTLKEVLQETQAKKYAVGAFNLLNMEALQGAVRAAEELRSPIIFQIAEVQLPASPLSYILPMMTQAAKQATVPVAIHFDHGLTLQNIIKALQLGCTSIMIDGSSLPFEENIALTKQCAEIAHAMGASCEAELGIVGGAEAGGYSAAAEEYTNVEQAVEFVERTGCDALAIAIGNAHGHYTRTPHLQLERLQQIRSAVSVPLVLHGGSGISDEDFRSSIHSGISKINVFTAIQENVNRHLRSIAEEQGASALTCEEVSRRWEHGTYEAIAQHMRIFMSDNKA